MHVLITGSNRGLGLEWTRQLLKRGDNVFATCRHPDSADQLQALLQDYPQNLTITALDIGDESSITAARQAIAKHTDKLDVLINNAGISAGSETLDSLDPDIFLNQMRVNALGPTIVVQQFLDLLKNGDNQRVLNITSSIASMTNWDRADMFTYPTSKAALNMLTRTLCVVLREFDIPIVLIDPGWVKTDMGGPDAWITADESISGMIKILDSLTIQDTGKFLHYSGSEIPW